MGEYKTVHLYEAEVVKCIVTAMMPDNPPPTDMPADIVVSKLENDDRDMLLDAARRVLDYVTESLQEAFGESLHTKKPSQMRH